MKFNGFSANLLRWYSENKRDLPWRNTNDPYYIWLSEVIMQQTRIDQGLSYYNHFVETYPDVQTLADADEDQVLRSWQGLGYYSRARNLHSAAKDVVERYGGKFPDSFKEIRSLKGVGDYTASAISSIAFNMPHPVVDGNVYRFLSRYFGIDTPIDSGKGKAEFRALAGELLPQDNPGDFNQAMMEYGALICMPAAPLCEKCVFQQSCIAFKTGNVAQLPVKGKKTSVRQRFLLYLFVKNETEEIYIQKRVAQDIWKGLYEFYLIESERDIKEEDIPGILLKEDIAKGSVAGSLSPAFKHQLSHQQLHARFLPLEIKGRNFNWEGSWVSQEELQKYAFPRLITRYLERGEI